MPADPARALDARRPQRDSATSRNGIARRAIADKKIEAVAAALARATRPVAHPPRPARGSAQRPDFGLGRREVGPPPNWDATVTAPLLGARGPKGPRAPHARSNQLFGDAKASAAQLALLQGPRRARSIATPRNPPRAFARDAYAAVAPGHPRPPRRGAPLRRDAIRALAAFDDNRRRASSPRSATPSL